MVDAGQDIMVSILVVTYNQEKFIERALNSLIAQKSKYRYEILVGDDASSDSTPDIIQRVAAKNPQANIVPVLRKGNMGATKNLLDLMKRARGKYIACCEGDDCWYGTDRLDTQVDFLEANREYSAHCGKVYLIDENDQIIPDDTIPKSKQFWKFDKQIYTFEDFAEWRMPCQVSALLFRKKFLEIQENLDICLAHPVVGDKSMMLALLTLGNIYCSDEVMGRYRVCTTTSHYMQQYEEKNLRDLDYDYTKKLETYARKMFRKDFSLSHKLKHIFVSAVCAWLKRRSYRNWQVIKYIYTQCDDKPAYAKLFFKTVALKSYYWHIKHSDTFINI